MNGATQVSYWQLYLICTLWSAHHLNSCQISNVTFAPLVDTDQEKLEQEYLEYYGNNIYMQREWTQLRRLWFAEKFDNISLFCKQFHEAAGKGPLETDDLINFLNINVLRYKGKHMRDFARIDVIKYARNRTDEVPMKKERRSPFYFITGGRGSHCVYYLEPTDDTCMEFYLEQHICVNSTLISEITDYYNPCPNEDLGKDETSLEDDDLESSATQINNSHE